MNLLKSLTNEHSRRQCGQIVSYIGGDPGRFSELVTLFLNGPYRITQRAAWPLSCCVENHPSLADPYLKKFVQLLRKKGSHVAVKRNVLRLLQFITIPRSLHGIAARNCFELFKDPNEPIAVKVFSMTALSHIALQRPALKRELKILIEDQMPFASAGFRARGQKLLKLLA